MNFPAINKLIAQLRETLNLLEVAASGQSATGAAPAIATPPKPGIEDAAGTFGSKPDWTYRLVDTSKCKYAPKSTVSGQRVDTESFHLWRFVASTAIQNEGRIVKYGQQEHFTLEEALKYLKKDLPAALDTQIRLIIENDKIEKAEK